MAYTPSGTFSLDLDVAYTPAGTFNLDSEGVPESGYTPSGTFNLASDGTYTPSGTINLDPAGAPVETAGVLLQTFVGYQPIFFVAPESAGILLQIFTGHQPSFFVPLLGIQQFSNRAKSLLASSITDTATTATITAGEGDLFASPTYPDFELVTLENELGTVFEIVKVTERVGDVFTITRGREGTAPAAFAAGYPFEARVTATSLDNFYQKNNASVMSRLKSESINLTIGPGPYSVTLPHDFLVKEVMFVVATADTVTIQATISVGTLATPTLILNAQATVGLTATNSVTRWVPNQPVVATDDLLITIDALATGTDLTGQFLIEGVYL